MINFLIIHAKLLITFAILLIPLIVFVIKTFIKRIKEGYWKKPHFKTSIGIYGKFGSGKGVYSMHVLRKYLKRFKHCNYKILTNMTLNLEEFKDFNFTSDKYKYFENVDDIYWLLDDVTYDAKGNAKPNFDFAIVIIDELCSVCGNRDMMQSKKGKGTMTKDFIGLLHQLRKLNCLVITQFQDDAIDITFKRIMDKIYVPHMHFMSRLNIVKIYNSRDIFAYLLEPDAALPEYLNKRMFLCTDAIFKSYDTNQLVKSLNEADYYRPNDADAPSYIAHPQTINLSSCNNKKMSFAQKLVANKNV